jgi:hypothetical protein
MTKIDVVQNDQLYNLNFSLQDANGLALDLSNIGTATVVRFKAQDSRTGIVVANSVMSIIDASLGTCYYQVASGVFTAIGRCIAEIEVTYGNGKIISLPDIVINVKTELPVS